MNYVPIILVIFFIAIVVVLHNKCRIAKFNEQFPPIDDDEFVRRCRPGTNRDIALRVRRIISTQLDIEYERIYPEHRFVEDLGCD